MLLLLISVAGLLRLGFDTDILAMLPGEVPEVKGVRAHRDVLERGGALIIVMECGEDDAGFLGEEAESLSKHLREGGLVSEARWRPVFEEDLDGLGELIAYLWINGDEGEWETMLGVLGEGSSRRRLERALNRLGTAMDVSAMQLSARDPFGFCEHPAASLFGGNEAEDGGYESSDGRLQLVFVRPAESVSGYHAAHDWIARVKGAAEAWQDSSDHGWVDIAYTGGPVFTSEVGDGMEKDVRGTVGLTLLLVSLLFWWMQRRLSLLVALGGMLMLIFVVTLGLASFIYGDLSMLSVGFASILIGLAVDYGMVICQEARVSGQEEKHLRYAVTKGIVWAAVTTAAVFASLCLSSLPGVRQLGVLVALGILAGSVIMLVFYVPIISGLRRLSFVRSQLEPGDDVRHDPGHWFLPPRVAVGLLSLCIVGAGVVIVWLGPPRLTFDFSVMQPTHSPGMEAMGKIKDRMPSWGSLGVQVVVEAGDDGQMLERLRLAQDRVRSSVERGEINGGAMPVGLWPNAEQQRVNRASLGRLLKFRERLVAEAREVGFTDGGMSLSLSVFDALERFYRQDGVVFPRGRAALEILNGFVWHDQEKGGGLAKGRVDVDLPENPNSEDLVALRRLNGEGAYTSGWALLSPAVLPMIHRDVTHVFFPMGVILLVMLIIVFRDVLDVLLVSACLAMPMLVVVSSMKILGIDWDMLNIVAIPLLLGMGMDYGIHMVMSLRRHAEAPEKVWQGIGKALMFCGGSTAIGFGSLSMASNEALAGMGTLCAVGILLTMVCSVFIMPGVWRVLHAKGGWEQR